jgi:hypothetical protein
MTGGTPFVEVWGYDYPCTQCQCALTWVSGLRPWYRARGRRTGHPRQAAGCGRCPRHPGAGRPEGSRIAVEAATSRWSAGASFNPNLRAFPC